MSWFTKMFGKDLPSDWRDLLHTDYSYEDVNRWVNRKIRYIGEPRGRDQYQAPLDTLERCTGDCEDYVILKKHILMLKGFSDSATKLVYVSREDPDPTQRSHMVLALGDGQLIMDNMTDRIQPLIRRGDLMVKLAADKQHFYLPKAYGFTIAGPAERIREWSKIKDDVGG